MAIEIDKSNLQRVNLLGVSIVILLIICGCFAIYVSNMTSRTFDKEKFEKYLDRTHAAQSEYSLQKNMSEALKSDPDRASRVVRLAIKNNLPIDVVDKNLERLEQNDKFDRIDFLALQRKSPALAHSLQDQEKAKITEYEAKEKARYLNWLKGLAYTLAAAIFYIIFTGPLWRWSVLKYPQNQINWMQTIYIQFWANILSALCGNVFVVFSGSPNDKLQPSAVPVVIFTWLFFSIVVSWQTLKPSSQTTAIKNLVYSGIFALIYGFLIMVTLGLVIGMISRLVHF